jgi:tetratricopeptide (TPR) repeat protein
MVRDPKQLVVTAIIVVAAFGAVFSLSAFVEGARPKLPPEYADSDLSLEGKRLKGYALGSEGLLADWYWILSLQYLGGKFVDAGNDTIDLGDLRSLNPRLLYPYLDNATDLDPKFYAAYSYGAIVLPAINTEQAIALAEKGIRNNPDKWRLHQYLGYIYWRQKNYEKAAETYEEGSKIEGAPPFMIEMVAGMRAKGGSREIARAIYRQLLTESEDEQSKRNAQLRLYQLSADEEMEAVNGVLATTKTSTGRCPAKLSEIFPQLTKITLSEEADFRIDKTNALVDPTGVPYFLDPKSCKVFLGGESKVPRSVE